MKNLMFLFVGLLSSLLFVSTNQAQTPNNNVSQAIIEVIYFHATGRCPACLAVENNTKKFLEENFKAEMDNGLITFSSINFDETEGRKLADKYEVVFSALLIIKKEPKEVKTDFTNEGFQYAKTNPDKFKSLLVNEIQKNLN
jgi:hypothetical protein